MTDILMAPDLTVDREATTIQLQTLILPKLDICTVESLYVRLNKFCLMDYEKDAIELKAKGKISFDTYFNAFSVDKWKSYTSLEKIDIQLTSKGSLRIKLLNLDSASDDPILISQKIVHHSELSEETVFSDVQIQAYRGLIYLEIEALEDGCIFKSSSISTTKSGESEAQKIAIVICTYRRETYVQQNIQRLEPLWSSSPKSFELFVIDNGNTLEACDQPYVHIIPNHNVGGSGGFARGMIEVLEREDEFSHITLMDDDVIIDPEVFERIYSFQYFAKNRMLCLGGSMLKLDSKYTQHEKGAIWDDEIIRSKPDLDLREVENLLFNEVEEYINYNAWWLFCFPLKVMDRQNLPYPFFIRMDDVEFSTRLDLQIVTLNSICVWHDSFDNKYSPYLNYYMMRNEMIFNALTSKNVGRLSAAKRVFRFSIREAFCYRYKGANLILEAAADFLKGPDYLKSIDPAQKNTLLSGLGEKPAKNSKQPFIKEKYNESVTEVESTLHQWFRLLTLNGHLLPSFLFHHDRTLRSKGYRIAPIRHYRPINTFRAKTVLFYHSVTQDSFTVQRSQADFWQVLGRAIALSCQVFLQYPKLKLLYREMHPEMTSLEFWKSYLKLDAD